MSRQSENELSAELKINIQEYVKAYLKPLATVLITVLMLLAGGGATFLYMSISAGASNKAGIEIGKTIKKYQKDIDKIATKYNEAASDLQKSKEEINKSIGRAEQILKYLTRVEKEATIWSGKFSSATAYIESHDKIVKDIASKLTSENFSGFKDSVIESLSSEIDDLKSEINTLENSLVTIESERFYKDADDPNWTLMDKDEQEVLYEVKFDHIFSSKPEVVVFLNRFTQTFSIGRFGKKFRANIDVSAVHVSEKGFSIKVKKKFDVMLNSIEVNWLAYGI